MNTSASGPVLAMRWAAAVGIIDRVTRLEPPHHTVHGHLGGARDHEPVFGAALVPLIAEAAPRLHIDALHLVDGRFVKNRVGAPGSLTVLAAHG